MKVVTIEQTEGTDREVKFTGGTSFRPVLAKDGLGFSVHKTVVKKGSWHWHYKNHLESCYCIEGYGVLLNLENGKRYEIKPDTVYMLDKHDDHEFIAFEGVVLISVFNPPIVGDESHDENGNYELKTKEYERV